MADEPILYDQQGKAMYVGVERVSRILVIADEFRSERRYFEQTVSQEPTRHISAKNTLTSIQLVRATIPNEVRGFLSEHFRLSDKDLGELEARCLEALAEKGRHPATFSP